MKCLLSGLDHLQLAIPPGGENRARQFLGELLGLEEIAKPAALAANGGCWFRGPGIELHIGIDKDFRPQRKGHPAFLVPDLEALRARLEEAGCRVKPDDRLPDRRRFYCDDPFGNRLEFLQQEDGFSRR